MTRILLLVMSMSLGFLSHGQFKEDKVYSRFKSKANYFIGFVTLKDSTMLNGVIKRTKSILADGDIKIVTKTGEKRSLYARQVFGYEAAGEKHVTFEDVFYKVRIENPRLSLYTRIGTNVHTMPAGPNGAMSTYTTTYIMYFVKKAGEVFPTFVPSRKRKFKDFASYFSDCDTLSIAIASGDLKHQGITEIVKKYNGCEE